ncbi:MAG: UrcA family protein, partial [Gammaproteobacteria bacterium]|nr:UrcA family protein [Gammaproteobacteria bacterium]
MRKILTGLMLGMIATTLGGVSAYAGPMETVTVTGSRAVTEKDVGRSITGVHVREVSLSYRVSAVDLDLTSSAGRAELERRVRAAASAACKELDRLALGNPTSPDDATCIR